MKIQIITLFVALVNGEFKQMNISVFFSKAFQIVSI